MPLTSAFTSIALHARVLFTESKEKLYIYLVGSVSGILVSLVLFVIVRLIWKRRTSRGGDKFGDSRAGNTSLPHSFNDEISEVDADITLAEVMPPVTVIPSHHHISSPGEVMRAQLLFRFTLIRSRKYFTFRGG